MIRDILISTAITLFVSAIITTIAVILYNYEVVKTFIVVTLLQLVIFYLWNTLLQTWTRISLEREQTKRVEEYTKQGAEVQCAYCKSINFIPIRLDLDNEFECSECEKINSVYIDILTAQKTDIIDKDRLSITSYINDNKTEQPDVDKNDEG